MALRKRVTNLVGHALSAPSRMRSGRRARQAAQGINAIRFLRKARPAKANPRTEIGRQILRAEGTKRTAAQRLKRRKRK